MWAIKILKGPNAGQIIKLHKGEQKIGRAETCVVQLQSPGISKEHASLTVTDADIMVQDLGSRNGTFVNGVKVRARPLKLGDRLSFHNIILEIVNDNAIMSQMPASLTSHASSYSAPSFDGNAALSNIHVQSSTPSPQASAHAQFSPESFGDTVKGKFDTLVLPEVLKLSQSFEYRWVIGAFVLIYVILVTTLSVIPMIRVTQSSIEKESQRRAMTIAQGLADRYKIALANGTSGNFETRFAEREEGVTAAFILSASDGSIIAPVSRSGAYADQPFVHTARKKDEALTAQIDSQTIGSSIPIAIYDQDTGLMTPKAYAMVIYNMGSLAVDNGRMVSLFTQVLGIAILAGLLLFIFLYKVIEAPISNLNLQLDKALTEGSDKVGSPYDFEPLQKLVLNINSSLSRSGSDPSMHNSTSKDIYSEATQLVRIMMNPAFATDSTETIIALNSSFASLLNISLTQLDSSSLNSIPDDAITTIASELIAQAKQQSNGFVSSPIHFKGRDLEMNAQPVRGHKGIEYIIITLTSVGGESE